MPSKTEICNIALSHLGIDKEIGNVETENSAEARAARRLYETTRDTTLRDFPWPFATKIAALGLIEEEPNTEWAFSYRMPTDCVYLRRLFSGIRNDTRDTRAPYKIAQDDSGLLLFTDYDDVQAEYTVRATDTNLYPPDFVLAFSLLLASLMAPRITAGDPFKLGARALGLYEAMKDKAQSNSMNEEQHEREPEAESILARE